MDSEHLGREAAAPPAERTPFPGLRLWPLPACGDPSFPVFHEYFEVVYGPLIGPSSFLLARTLARHIAQAGGPVTVCPVELAREVGLRASGDAPIGKSSHLAKSLQRLAHHRLLERQGTGIIAVSMDVPPLSVAVLSRLPATARQVHRTYLGGVN